MAMGNPAGFCMDSNSGQPAASHMGLSPGILATLGRVQQTLRKVLAAQPQSSLPDVAQGLADQGLLVTLRSGLGVGIDAPDYLSTLRHSFLICQEGSSGLCIIVDPSFQEQFGVAGMPASSSYSAAVANVPKCFVGTIVTLNALVCLLTGTLQQESSALGIELPPWRSKQALLSKWLPRRFADSVFTPPSFATLHPALKSSVHGTLSSSPVSIQSFQSTQRVDSRVSSSAGTSPDACCSGSSTARTSSPRALPEPHTVIKGFDAPAPAQAAQANPPSPQASTPTVPAAQASAAPSPVSPRCSYSALTQQLAAASAASRIVQLQAEAHWQSCLLAPARGGTQCGSLALCSSEPGSEQASLSSSPCLLKRQAAQRLGGNGGDVCRTSSGDVGRGIRGGSVGTTRGRSTVDSIVVSPALRRGSGATGMRRATCTGLKAGPEALKMLPRIHTVKLAAVAAC